MPAQAEAEDFISVGARGAHPVDRPLRPRARARRCEQYAWTRVHGAVLDELRRQDWAPRSVRRWERDIEKAVEEFTALHQRRPDREELAEALGITRRGAAPPPRATSPSPTSPRSTPSCSPTDDTTIERDRHDRVRGRAPRPRDDGGAHRRPRTRFRDAFAELPEREREIAVLLYVKNLTLAEIGDVIGRLGEPRLPDPRADEEEATRLPSTRTPRSSTSSPRTAGAGRARRGPRAARAPCSSRRRAGGPFERGEQARCVLEGGERVGERRGRSAPRFAAERVERGVERVAASRSRRGRRASRRARGRRPPARPPGAPPPPARREGRAILLGAAPPRGAAGRGRSTPQRMPRRAGRRPGSARSTRAA